MDTNKAMLTARNVIIAMRTLLSLFVFTFLILAVSVRDELGTRVAEVTLWCQIRLSVSIHHEATAVVIGTVGKSEETMTKFMKDDFPEL